ncbi:MAG: GNAT family N-acetyltransferase [Mangrovibacterium sp.]
MDNSVSFCYCDFSNEMHCTQLANLINHYISDPMGGGTPLTPSRQLRMVDGLANHPASFVLFISVNDQIAGLATCFINFSTFKAKPYINLHDIIIDKDQRGKGYGKLLLKKLEEIARERNYCKITLEVREDNYKAQNLYKGMGYDNVVPVMFFWTKEIS